MRAKISSFHYIGAFKPTYPVEGDNLIYYLSNETLSVCAAYGDNAAAGGGDGNLPVVGRRRVGRRPKFVPRRRRRGGATTSPEAAPS